MDLKKGLIVNLSDKNIKSKILNDFFLLRRKYIYQNFIKNVYLQKCRLVHKRYNMIINVLKNAKSS
jgi:hypothetical protein